MTKTVTVKSEPATYGPDSPESYFLDLCRSSHPGSSLHDAAVRRLHRHSVEVGMSVVNKTSEGQRAVRSMQTRGRAFDGTEANARAAVKSLTEYRAMTTASNSGGAFVTPQYLTEDWADYRSFEPTFADQTVRVHDEGYGMQINVPSITSAASVAQQTEGSAVVNSNPTGAYITSNLVTFAGEVDISQQLFDRSGPLGIDQAIYKQLGESLMTQVDTYVINQALASAASVTGASVWSNANLYGDVAKASAAMRTAAGTVLPPTHAFFSPTFFQWAMAQVDTSGRPLLTPNPSGTYLPITAAPDGGVPAGYTGLKLLSSNCFVDGNIPNAGSNTQIIICNPANVYSLVSEPVTRAFPETLAQNLNVVLQLFCVAGVVVRHGAAVQTITSNAYPASPTFA